MAGTVRYFTRLNLKLLRNNVFQHTASNQIRTLFSEQSLGMQSYLQSREQYKTRFQNLEDAFRSKMQSYVEDASPQMIFTEDLKTMLHIIENKPEDVELVVKMLKKFNSQSNDLRFGAFNFGPIAMRALHRLNAHELAIELFNDPNFEGFFNQLTSYQILLDLLYKNQRYKTIIETYETIRGKITDGKMHPRNALIITFAACYKENTEESFKYATELWRDLCDRGYPSVRRITAFISALALKQGQPHVALEILGKTRKSSYISIRCLKIMAYVDINRFVDIVSILRWPLQSDDSTTGKATYFKDTIDYLEAGIAKNGIGPDSEVVKLLNIIKSNNMVQNETLEDHINSEIVTVPKQPFRYNETNRTHQASTNISGPAFIRRPGLRDML